MLPWAVVNSDEWVFPHKFAWLIVATAENMDSDLKIIKSSWFLGFAESNFNGKMIICQIIFKIVQSAYIKHLKDV